MHSVACILIVSLQPVFLTAGHLLCEQASRIGEHSHSILGIAKLNAKDHGVAHVNLNVPQSKFVPRHRDAQCIEGATVCQTFNCLAASAWKERQWQKPRDRSWRRSRNATRSHAVQSRSEDTLATQFNDTARRNMRITKRTSVPWDEKAEKLYNVGTRKDSCAVRELKEFVLNRRSDLGAAVEYAKTQALTVRMLPRAFLKQWIRDTQNRVGGRSPPADSNAILLSRAALCFTATDPGVFITTAEPLASIGERDVSWLYKVACEIIVAALAALESGGAAPERAHPSTVYFYQVARRRAYCFWPSASFRRVNIDAVGDDDIANFTEGLVDVISFLKKRVTELDELHWDFSKELNETSAAQLLQWRSEKAGFAWAAKELHALMRHPWWIKRPLLSTPWFNKLCPRTRIKIYAFIQMTNQLFYKWRSVQKGKPDRKSSFIRCVDNNLGRLITELRKGKEVGLLRAWKLARLLLLEEKADLFVRLSKDQLKLPQKRKSSFFHQLVKNNEPVLSARQAALSVVL